MPRILIILGLIGFLGSSPVRGELVQAEAVVNAFVAAYAKEEVTWRKDIRLGAAAELEPGRLCGHSAIVGAYSFLPKVWGDFSTFEREAILSDPRLKGFLVASRISNSVEKEAISVESLPPVPVSVEPLASKPLVIKVSPLTVVENGRLHVEIK